MNILQYFPYVMLAAYFAVFILLLRIDFFFTRYVPPEAPEVESDLEKFTLTADDYLRLFPKQ